LLSDENAEFLLGVRGADGLRGELLLTQGAFKVHEAERSLRTSIENRAQAERQILGAARYDESRAPDGKQGHRDEARATLTEIDGWFTEGFDTADLEDAKASLDELKA